MNLNNEKYILTILQEGSFSKAAKKLYISQPALSQTVKLVENELGIKIFSRKGKSLTLTEEGEKYIDLAKQMTLLERNFYDEIKDLQHSEVHTIRFGISTQMGKTYLHNFINKYEKIHPQVKFEVQLKGSIELEKMIADDLLDVAITSNMSMNWNLTYDFLNEEIIGILAGKDSNINENYENGDEISIEDTINSKYIFLKEGHYSRMTQDELFKLHNIKIEDYIEVDSFEIGKNLAIHCGRIMVCPLSLIENDPEYLLNKGSFHPLVNIQIKRKNYLTYRKNRYLSKHMLDWMDIVKSFLN